MKYNIIITAGGTSEKIDNVRKITNSGSGRLGSIIAERLIELEKNNINTIYYICSNNSIKPNNNKKIKIIEIEDTNNLFNVVKELLTTKQIDIFIHSMAVSDYMVQYITTAEDISEEIENSSKEKIIEILKTFNKGLNDNKISSYEENLIIKLKRTPKIISMIKDLSPNTLLVGFKLLDKVSKKKLLDVALRLKEKNKCDLVVANDLSKINKNHHKAFIIRDKNNYIEVSNKEEIADKLTYEVFKMRGVLND